MADMPMVAVTDLEDAAEWIHGGVENDCFEGDGGPLQLGKIIRVFRLWVYAANDPVD